MNFKVSASLLCWACTECGGYKLEATLFHAQSITASNWVMFLNPKSSDAFFSNSEGPCVMQILELEKRQKLVGSPLMPGPLMSPRNCN